MIDPYLAQPIKVLEIKKEGRDCKLFTLARDFDFEPGQFVMAGLPGFGEAAFSLCAGNQICVRKVGVVTSALHGLKKGEEIFIRGPYGRGWPKKPQTLNPKPQILIVAGGCGIISMRPLLKEKNITIFYGVKTKEDLLFKDEHRDWSNLHISIEPKMITELFDEVELPENIVAFVCGPPAMFKFVIQKLKERKVPDKNIYLSLERRIYCGIGVCQHCAIGTKYVCQDGPVFSLNELKNQPF